MVETVQDVHSVLTIDGDWQRKFPQNSVELTALQIQGSTSSYLSRSIAEAHCCISYIIYISQCCCLKVWKVYYYCHVFPVTA